MRYDLIVHVNREEDFSMKAALGAAGNYLAALPDGNFKLVLLANGPAVKFFKKDSVYASEIERLQRSLHLSLVLCRHALEGNAVTESELIPGCRIVPAGIVELARLQAEGFAYVKP